MTMLPGLLRLWHPSFAVIAGIVALAVLGKWWGDHIEVRWHWRVTRGRGARQTMSGETDSVVSNTPVRRAMPRRIERLTLPSPYDDCHVVAWINFSGAVKADLVSGDEARVRAALGQIVIEHDLVGFDGETLPPSTDPGFVEALPNEVLEVIIAAIRENVGKLPPTPAPR